MIEVDAMGTNTATECRTTSCAPQAVPDPPRVSHSHAGVTEWLCAGSLRERGQAKGTALPDVLWDSISLQHFLREIYSCNTHLCGLLLEERNFSGKMELSVSSSTQSKSKNKPRTGISSWTTIYHQQLSALSCSPGLIIS